MIGQQLKEDGIAQVTKNTDPDWKTAYVMVAEALLMSYAPGKLFTGGDVNDYIKEVIGDPHAPQAWSAAFGGLIRQYLKHNLVSWEGFTKSTKRSNHAHYVKQYKKL